MSEYPYIEPEEVVFPQMTGYRMACCDCGLVHEIDFEVVEVMHDNPDGSIRANPTPEGKYRVTLTVRRHEEDTQRLRAMEDAK